MRDQSRAFLKPLNSIVLWCLKGFRGALSCNPHDAGKRQPLGQLCPIAVHTEKYFRNLIKSTRNQIVFTIFQLIWNHINRRMVNTIWFRVDLIRFRKYFSACRETRLISRVAVRETNVSQHYKSQFEGPPETPRTIRALSYWGVWGAPHYAEVHYSRSESGCIFFPVGREFLSEILHSISNCNRKNLGVLFRSRWRWCENYFDFISREKEVM